MRLRPFILVALIGTLAVAPLAWAANAAGSASAAAADRSPGALVSHTLSTVTGVAISPLLGTSALGAYQWVTAKDAATRARLPWYAEPRFWVPALLVVGICAAKDASGVALPPLLKKPLDTLEVVENKFSGLIAAGAVVPFATDALWKLVLQQSGGTAAVTDHGLAIIPFAMSWSPVLNLLTVPFAIAVFLVVWMASHAINVLILLSPWGAIDAALKGARTALLGLLTLTAAVNPWWGALLSLAVIVVAYFVAGWSFRLTVFGTVLSWDFLTGRSRRHTIAQDANAMFSAARLSGVPVRTYGRLRKKPEGLEFSYRPWLVLQPRTAEVTISTAQIAVGRGLVFSTITSDAGALFLLPPRYRGHEEELVRCYAFGGGIRPAGLRKAWGALRELFGGRETTSVPTTT